MTPLDWRSWSAFAASLGDTQLSTASLHNQARGIGHSTPTTAAFIYPDGALTADHADSRSLSALRRWLDQWETTGRPTADAYTTRLIPHDDPDLPGWDLRLQL